ncbi:carboxyl-terminal processing protease [Catalinimonas alkaloidigena]|uniref:Carboxyl-terminal processing protease n=1 Tax=Catalinimonas alkaloidigena TaxID=1075417 RepID=A0A1G9MKN8_9BACT|nr:S41 family peptidase [Catalinimonas alkaloidigena]SDL74215.1 carboxyl-terminal processing protease [Catalinimonas alkaloidigena]
MKKTLKQLRIPFVAILLFVGTVAFTPSERYFEIAKNLDIFATLFKEVNTYYVDEVHPSGLIKTGIDAMLASLDPYTNYIPEDEIEDYRTMTTGQYGGIGAVIGKRNEKTLVLMPYEGYPANKAGLQIGDEILEIDDLPVADKSSGEVSKLLKGQANTTLNLKVKRYGVAQPLNISITREKIKIDNVPYYGMVNNDVGYFRLSDFTSDASREVKKAVTELKAKGAKKLIFDLRDNPGGLLSEAVNISNIFIEKDAEVVSTKGKVTEWNKTYRALNPSVDTDIPLVVLTSSRSASASEIVSGVIQDYDRGVLVGERTYGKGLVQATRPLTYNSQLKITTAKYYIPSGRCIQAIDYSHRDEDGSVSTIPDSLRVAFKTKNGRTVYDGGGILPDIEVEEREYSPITMTLVNKGLLFDYATEYASKHKTIASAKEFAISDQEYNEFVKWLTNKDYDYSTRVESNLKELEENAKKEKYFDGIKEQLSQLQTQISHDKNKDLQKNKDEIKEALEQEIVSRYYLQRGSVEASFDDDEDILAALDILNNPDKFAKLLSN